jgi:hypothetical protein
MLKKIIPFLMAVFLWPTVIQAQTHYTVSIGGGTSTSDLVPSNAYYNYSFAQMIYTANEVGIDGNIDTVSFYVGSGSDTRNWTIYMAEVGQTMFGTTVPASQFRQVYNGPINLASGWVDIALDSTFYYHDTASLVICVIDGTGSYTFDRPYYYGAVHSDSRSLYASSDYTTYNLTSMPTGTTSTFLPACRIGISSYTFYCSSPTNVTFDNINSGGADIAWTETGSASSWEIVVSDTAITDFIDVSPITTSTASYTAYGLTSNTLYYVYVRAVCDASSNSGWVSTTFRTLCSGYTPIPFAEGFEDFATGTMPYCWTPLAQGSSSSGTFPSVYSYASNAYNGNVYLEFESSNGETEIIALPEMENIHTLQLSFYASVMNTNPVLEAGVIEDTLFVPIDTVRLIPGANNQWQRHYHPYTIRYTDYSGTGERMALRVTSTTNYTLILDNVQVDVASSCPPPSNFRAVSPNSGEALLTWSNPEGYEWEVIYDTADFNPDSNDLIAEIVNDTMITLTNLNDSQTYTAYVRNSCGGDYSTWAGPVTFTPGTYVMDYIGSDTIRTCHTLIYDNGGPNGNYSAYDNFTLVVYPSNEDSLVVLSGSTDLYTTYAHLRIYDGVGTEGRLLWGSSTRNETFSNVRSTTGPVTIQFNAGTYTYNYNGFEILALCTGAPQCAFVENVAVTATSAGSARLQWDVAGLNLGIPESYIVDCFDTNGILVAQSVSSSPNAMISGLAPVSTYKAKVRAACENNEYGAWDSIFFTTRPLPCIGFDTNIVDSLLLAGADSPTSTYLPVYNYSAYSYSQQIVTREEMQGSTLINGMAFNYASSTPDSAKGNCAIYLANTTVRSLNTTFVPFDSNTFQMVYHGPFIGRPGWNLYHFDTPFQYDGFKNLLVVVVDSSGAYTSGSAYFAHTAGDKARYSTGYSTPVDISTTTGNSTTYRNDMRFYVSGCATSTQCYPPIVAVDSAVGTDIHISWAPGYEETSWTVEYRAVDTTIWTNEGTFATTSHTITNLNSDTRYIIRVTGICSDSNMSSEVTVRTPCVAQPLPFNTGFEEFATSGDVTPSCWHKGTTYSYGSYPYASTSYVHSGSQSLIFYSGSSNHTYLVLPALNAPINTLEVSLWAFNSSSYSTPSINVGVMSDPEDFSTFSSIGVIEPTEANVWQSASVRLNNYSGTAKYIAIAQPDNTSGTIYIDDLSVAVIRPCPTAGHVAASYIGTNTATITWDSTDVIEYLVEYGPIGFAHDSGTVATVYNDHSITLAGLTPNSVYDVYVASVCGDDTANWSMAYTFRTNCASINTLPYFTSFEDVPSSWIGSSSANFYPCWTRTSDPSSSYYTPYIYNPYAGSHTGSYCIDWYWSSYNSFAPIITLPAVDIEAIALDTLMLSFWAKNSSSYDDEAVIAVGVMNSPSATSTFLPLDTVTVTSTDWQLYEIHLDSYTGNGNYIALKVVEVAGSSWTTYIDDVTLDRAPACAHVSDLAVSSSSATSVDISWTHRGSATEYQVSVDTIASPIPTITVYDTTATTIAGLTSSLRYYIYVRAICGVGDTSEWEGPELVVPGAWNMRPNQIDTLYMCGGIIFDNGGPTGSYAASQDSYIILMPDSADRLVSVSGMSQTDHSYHYFIVYDGIGNDGPVLYSDYGLYDTTTFGPLVSSNGPLTLYLHSDYLTSPAYFGFEVNVSCVTTYCRVTDIALDSTVPQSSTTLALTWHSNGASSYQLEYGTSGFTLGTGTLVDLSTTNAVISGLTPLGVYDVYIRSICGAGDTGVWNRATFQTLLCDGATAAYSFDPTTYATTSSYSPLGNSNYNYSYVQTIIDSARLSNLDGDISAFAFHPNNTTASQEYNNITIYMANVNETELSSAFLLPDSTHTFVKVLDSANLNYSSTGWQIVQLDTTFAWDGHSNILFAVKRDNGDYTYGAQFAAHNTTTAKTRYSSNDNHPYNITDPMNSSTGSGSVYAYTENKVADLQLLSCGASCAMPSNLYLTNDYHSATTTWTGSGANYEVNIKESSADNWPITDIHVTGNTYTFNSLLPTTSYTIRVRQDCTADGNGYSEWVMLSFVTDSLSCPIVSNLHTTTVTNATATLDWMPNGTESMWEIHVWYSGSLDSIYTVSTHPATIGIFTANTTYKASVRPLCGSEHEVLGDWSDTITFTTTVCPDVTNLRFSDVTASSVTLNWDADPMAEQWIIEYGFHGFDLGSGTTVVTTLSTYTINGLVDNMEYDFRVRAICGSDWQSEGWATITVTTGNVSEECDPVTNLMASSITESSALITWIPGLTGNEWEIILSDTRGATIGQFRTIERQHLFTGLTPGFTYNAKVHTICGYSIYSTFASVSFTTVQVGIDDVVEPACTIYPNPTSSATTIRVVGISGKVKIAVVDMNGREVSSETLECSGDCANTMDVDGLAQGAYFVRITSGNVSMVKKLIVR